MKFPDELRRAVDVACRCSGKDHRKARVGCVIRRDDGAIVGARNLAILMPTSSVSDAHAEARATRKADVGAVAYVARVRRDGSIGNAMPCRSCQMIMRARGVERAYYTLSDDEWDCVELDPC